MNLDLIETWSMWFRGTSLENVLLWGISMVWWARIGLIAQYAGALTIIVDIVGPERLRSYGKKLSTVYSIEDMKTSMGARIQWMKKHIRSVTTDDKEEKTKLDKELAKSPLTWITVVGSFAIAFNVIRVTWGEIFWLWALLLGVLSLGACVYAIPAAILGVLIVISLIGLVIASVFVHPIAWMLENPFFDRFAKIVGIALISVGFHFDLLAT